MSALTDCVWLRVVAEGDFNGDANPNDIFLTVEGFASPSVGAENQMWLTDGAGTYTAVQFADIVTAIAFSHGAVVVSAAILCSVI